MRWLAETLNNVNVVVVCLLAVASCLQCRRRRGAEARWVVVAFAALASLFLVQRFTPDPATGALAELAEKVFLALGVAFPYFLYRFAACFRPPPRRIARLVGAFTCLILAWTLLLPWWPYASGPRPGWEMAYIAGVMAHWLVLSWVVASWLWRAGDGQPAGARYWMRTLSLGCLLLTFAVVLDIGTGPRSTGLDLALRLSLLVGPPLFYFGFWPPGVVRMVWRRRAEAALVASLDELMLATRREQLVAFVLARAVDLVGGSGAELVDGDGKATGSLAVPPPDGPDSRAPKPSATELSFSFGTLRLWSSPYTPFFGDNEFELVRSLGALAELGFERVAASEKEAQLAAIVESSNDAILATALDGTILSWNAGAEGLYGYKAQEMLGQPIAALAPPELLDEVTMILEKNRRGEGVDQHETQRVRKDGKRTDVSLTVSPIRNRSGTIIAASTIARDVTQRKRLELELAAARDRALDASRAKSEFLAAMSHEIRTPMNAVLGMSDLLLRTRLSPRQRDYAETVQRSTEGLLAVINDILDLSRVEAGRIELEQVDFEIQAVVEEVASLLAGPAQHKGLELITEVGPNLPELVAGDPGRLAQVLTNLVGNAVKFTHHGEVVTRARLLEETCEVAVVRLEVADTGIGIAPEVQARLFTSFSQGDASITRRYGGTGLGLAISKQLVELMGGEIGMSSEVGKGSTFWFTAPLKKRSPSHLAVHAALAGRRALVVNHNDTNRVILEHTMSSWGMRPVGAKDAYEALILLRPGGHRDQGFDAAVLDLHLPGMNGLELARAVRADRSLDGVALVLLTAPAGGGEIEEIGQADIDAFLTKPVRRSSLHRVLTEVLAIEAAPAAAESAGARVPEAGASARILVVDDNVANQKVATEMLESLGHRVEVAASGVEAVEAVAGSAYDLVLMDVRMPEMDGFEATTAIRCIKGRASSTPIVAMTAGVLSDEEGRCLATGMDGYVTKPVRIAGLAKAVERWAAVPVDQRGGPELDSEVLEWLRGRGRATGRDVLGELVPVFLRDAGDHVQRLRQAVERSEHDILASASHALKGTSGTLGAHGLARLSAALEEMGMSGELSGAAGVLAQLQQELERVAARLHDLTYHD